MTAGPWAIGNVAAVRDGTLLPPPPAFSLAGPYVYDTWSARRVPSVSRCIQVYTGLCKQMRMDAYRGDVLLDQPRLLVRPDPTRARSWFTHVSVEDYLLEGNAIARVTSRGVDGWPLAVQWIPAAWTYIQWAVGQNRPDYYVLGQLIPFDDVIHVRRGADRFYPIRGVGVVEENLATLDRVAMEEAYERQTLAGASVPSVAIITPGATLTQEVADQAKTAWQTKFGGPVREPAILPNGTQVIPLAWSPSDTQLVEARKMSLTDVANMFNVDGYWLGAPTAGITYKTSAPQYQQILRTSLEPVLSDFEDVWSDAWLPRGTTVVFDRNKLLRDDLPTTALAITTLVGADVMSADEARAYLMGQPLDLSGPAPKPPKPPPPPPGSAPPPLPAAADTSPPDRRCPSDVERRAGRVRFRDPRHVDGHAPYTRIEGRAVPYDTWANVGAYLERFRPDAFKKSVGEGAKALPLMLFHGRDDMWPIGMSTGWSSKPDGLYGRWQLNGSPNAQRAAEMAASGELGFLSIGFVDVRSVPKRPPTTTRRSARTTWTGSPGSRPAWSKPSIVPTPAYADAQVTLVRSTGAGGRPAPADGVSPVVADRAG